MARALVAEQTGSTLRTEGCSNFTHINWGYAVVRCLMIPLSSAAGYFDDQEHRGTRLAALAVAPAFTCKPAERKSMTAC
jgi:hypothetical protein